MNILFVTQEFPPETGGGGIGTSTYNLARALAHQGHGVHVLASAVPPGGSTDSKVDGITVHRIRRRKFEVPLLRRLWINYLPWTKHQWEYLYSVHKEIDNIIRVNNIDIIESPEIWAEGILYSLRRRVPIVVKLHTPLFVVRELDQLSYTVDRRLVELVDEVWTRRADRVISASWDLARLVSRKYHFGPAEITVVPEAVNAEDFGPGETPARGQPIVLFVGRLEPRKGIFDIAEAMPIVLADCPGTRFVFLGGDMMIDGRSSKAALLERMRRHGVAEKAEFPGRVAADQVAEYQRQSAVSIFPSTWENCAVACLEAMACGRPVIATNVGGFPEMIEPGKSGVLIPPGRADALADAIKHMLADPEQARHLGTNARRRIEERFAADVVARQSLVVYEETIRSWNQAQAPR